MYPPFQVRVGGIFGVSVAVTRVFSLFKELTWQFLRYRMLSAY